MVEVLEIFMFVTGFSSRSVNLSAFRGFLLTFFTFGLGNSSTTSFYWKHILSIIAFLFFIEWFWNVRIMLRAKGLGRYRIRSYWKLSGYSLRGIPRLKSGLRLYLWRHEWHGARQSRCCRHCKASNSVIVSILRCLSSNFLKRIQESNLGFGCLLADRREIKSAPTKRMRLGCSAVFVRYLGAGSWVLFAGLSILVWLMFRSTLSRTSNFGVWRIGGV